MIELLKKKNLFSRDISGEISREIPKRENFFNFQEKFNKKNGFKF